jgi:hypothetical protein
VHFENREDDIMTDYYMQFGYQANPGLTTANGAPGLIGNVRALADVYTFQSMAYGFQIVANPDPTRREARLTFVPGSHPLGGGIGAQPFELTLEVPGPNAWSPGQNPIAVCFEHAYAPHCNPHDYAMVSGQLGVYLDANPHGGIDSEDFAGVVRVFDTACVVRAITERLA